MTVARATHTTGRTHRVRLALAMLLALGSVWAAQLSAPGAARACSCVPWPDSLAAYRTDENIRILSGTVVALVGQSGQFGIEQVFKGPVPGPNMAIDGGDAGMCGLHLELGAKLILASWTEGGVLRPSSCTPNARFPSAEADRMLADAVASYGGAGPPPGVDVEPTAPPAGTDTAPCTPDLALPAILGALLLAVVAMFAAIAIVGRRRARA